LALQKLKTEIQVKIEEILIDKDSKDWYNSLESDSTKETWPIGIAQYLLYRKITVKDLVKAFKHNNLRECKRLQAFVNELKEKRTPKTLNWLLSSIRSRLEYDGIELVKTIKIGNVNLTPTIAGEKIPSKEELKRIIQNAIIRSKAIIALIAFAGLRFKTISGLLVRDLPEIQIDNKNKTVRFSKVPAIINVRAELSKNRLPYFTFIIEEGCNLIKDYLEFRMHQNETITEESKLIQTPSKFTSFTKIRKTWEIR